MTDYRKFEQIAQDRMPEPIVDDTVLHITAAEIKEGDAYNNKTVSSVKVGTKRVTVLGPLHKEIGYLLKSDEVTVLREQETPESAAARKHVRDCVSVLVEADMAKRAYDKALVSLNERLAKYGIDSHAMTKVIETKAELDVWTVVLRSIREGVDELAAVAEVAEDLQLQALRGARGESGSTSAMHNVVEAINNQVFARFVLKHLHKGW